MSSMTEAFFNIGKSEVQKRAGPVISDKEVEESLLAAMKYSWRVFDAQFAAGKARADCFGPALSSTCRDKKVINSLNRGLLEEKVSGRVIRIVIRRKLAFKYLAKDPPGRKKMHIAGSGEPLAPARGTDTR